MATSESIRTTGSDRHEAGRNTLTHAEIKPVLNTAVNWTINFLVKKWILKKSGWMTKMLIPFVLKNITSHVIQKKMLWWKK